MAFINDLLNLLNTYGKFQVTKPDGSVETATELVITENGVRHTVWKAGNNVTYFVDNNVSYTVEVDNGASILKPTEFTPSKNGYTFMGWRRDKIATGAVLNAAVMEGDPVTLYAVFSKDITLTYYNATSKAATTTGKQYYNNGNITNPKFSLEQLEAPSWESRGWATNSKADAAVAYENIYEREFSEDTTVYALYQRTITLSYDGNGSTGGTTATQEGIRYWNSAGNYLDPSFILASNGFSRNDYAFSKWAKGSESGTQYSTGESITLTASTTFYALWSAVSIYVIQNGAITKSDYVQSANLSALEVGADNDEENGNSMTAFVLKNASRFRRVKIRFKYRTYADYGEHDVILNGTEIGREEYQYEWKEHSMYIDSTTCNVQLYARNDSSNEMWGAAAGFQLLDVYLEV